MEEWTPKRLQADPRAAFAVFDRYNKGYISSAELVFAVRARSAPKGRRSVRQRGSLYDEMRIFSDLDEDGDGVISLEEFVHVISIGEPRILDHIAGIATANESIEQSRKSKARESHRQEVADLETPGAVDPEKEVSTNEVGGASDRGHETEPAVPDSSMNESTLLGTDEKSSRRNHKSSSTTTPPQGAGTVVASEPLNGTAEPDTSQPQPPLPTPAADEGATVVASEPFNGTAEPDTSQPQPPPTPPAADSAILASRGDRDEADGEPLGVKISMSLQEYGHAGIDDISIESELDEEEDKDFVEGKEDGEEADEVELRPSEAEMEVLSSIMKTVLTRRDSIRSSRESNESEEILPRSPPPPEDFSREGTVQMAPTPKASPIHTPRDPIEGDLRKKPKYRLGWLTRHYYLTEASFEYGSLSKDGSFKSLSTLPLNSETRFFYSPNRNNEMRVTFTLPGEVLKRGKKPVQTKTLRFHKKEDADNFCETLVAFRNLMTALPSPSPSPSP